MLYVVGELSHEIIAFDLPTAPAENIQPIHGFAPNIVPPTVHPDYQSMMESGEMCFHPSISNVIYVSNRWERYIAQRGPHLRNIPDAKVTGDGIAIVLLAEDGRRVEAVKHVRGNADVIRGMRVSNDGKYVLVLGQLGGGVEIYEIGGSRGDIWTLTATLDHGLGTGLKHAIWL